MSPVFAMLSEKTDKITTGKEYPFNGEQFMRDIVRGILIALRNMSIELAITLGVLLLSFIPVIGILFSLVGSVFLFFVSAYFYGFSFMDYTFERKRLNISQSVRFSRRYRGLAIANGGLFALFLIIPFCGVILAPFFSIFSVVGATLAYNELEKNNETIVS